MNSDDRPQDSLLAAEIALGDADYETAEDALLETLSRVRQRKSGGASDD